MPTASRIFPSGAELLEWQTPQILPPPHLFLNSAAGSTLTGILFLEII